MKDTPEAASWGLLAGAGAGAFLLLGLIYPILGPALPALSAGFGLSATSAALLLSLNSAGAFAGVLAAGLLSGRWPPRARALCALVLIAAACLGLAFAPSFALAGVASLLLGLGFGLLDLTINVWLATSFGARSASVLNLLSAAFGVGAVLAPLAVGMAGGSIRLPLLGCAALAALLLPVLFAMRAPAPEDSAAMAGPARAGSGPSIGLTGGFALLFLTYVGVEGGIGAWEVTHLQQALGIGTAGAAKLASLFWVSFTLGRLLSGLLALRVEPAPLVIGSLALAAASIALATLPAAAVAGYTLAGLFLAPVFTTGLVWMSRTQPSSGVTTLVFASAFLGPVLFSPVLGALTDRHGPPAIPLTLLGIACVCTAVALGLRRALDRRARA
ncbi:MFS transporter [Ramlibacter tataouinensis]|uniref:Candidate membrane protein n=1 Tax=Ramlibacter tataouinensis (strain ATCC BAA-407 / DSM 14655 / LMG 21543 / TTB310) TaxID=365046 RepID=F5Y4I9_RAMTT|nr:MFS transporter [Ramlibacter tataouinensis]AEG93836.1 candidate membrane protein [Ramlibacter tataouinensis TTB310]